MIKRSRGWLRFEGFKWVDTADMQGNACIEVLLWESRFWEQASFPLPLFQPSDYRQVPSSPEVLVVLMNCNVGNVPGARP